MKFTFWVDEDPFQMEYEDFLENKELMRKVVDPTRNNLNLGLKIVSLSNEFLSNHPSADEAYKGLKEDLEDNPLKYFLPHCAKSPDFDTPSHRFINHLDPENRFIALVAPNQLGKALWDETDVQTPDGPVKIKDVTEGMDVFSRDGKSYKCTGVFPQGIRKTYKVFFGSDPVIADADHLWTVYKHGTHPHRWVKDVEDKWEVKTTKEIFENQSKGWWVVPRSKPVDYEARIQAPFREGYKAATNGTLLPKIKIRCKDREDMLKGIIVARGIKRKASYRLSLKDRKLADQIKWLVGSFGGTVNDIGHFNTPRLEIGSLPFQCIPQKGKSFVPSRNNVRTIRRIEEHEELPCTCISVDSPDNTFLCGNFFTTHNTTVAFAKIALTCGLIPNDPSWPVYKEHGVEYVPYTGKKQIAICSYNWDNFRTTIIPQVIMKWLPKSEKERYIKKPIGDPSRAGRMTLDCGSSIFFKAASQGQSAFESQVLDDVVLDEQMPFEKTKGLNVRMSTRYSTMGVGDKTVLAASRFIASFTPHVMPENPEHTGAAGWMRALDRPDPHDQLDLGPAFYHESFENTPHWVKNKHSVDSGYRQIEMAERAYANGSGGIQQVRSLRSRFLGEWEEMGGSVFKEFEEKVHVVDDFPIPDNWTARRGFDHGRTNPSAMVIVATAPNGDIFVTISALSVGTEIHETVENFVRECGNLIKDEGVKKNKFSHMKKRKEVCLDLHSAEDVLDCHTFRIKRDDSSLVTGDIYKLAGLTHLKKSSEMKIEKRIDLMRTYLRRDMSRPHFRLKDKDGANVMGAPRVYFFRKGAATLIKNLRNYRNKTVQKNGEYSEKPVGKDDHDIDALGYVLCTGCGWDPAKPCRGVNFYVRPVSTKPVRGGDRFTGI